MKIKKVTAVYFSPTKGTKDYVMRIAKGLSENVSEIDLTLPENRKKEVHFDESDLVIFGAPVYAGRLPQIEGGIFDQLKGKNTPAIFNVSYGNREYDDALLEEKDICEENGFVGIAAGAWLAPHSFSDKIAAGRPDAKDINAIESFIGQVKTIIEKEVIGNLSVQGNKPYRELKKMPFFPDGDENCTNCNDCVKVCPVGAISEEDPRQTDTGKCIDCLACVRICPVDARKISSPMFGAFVTKLETGLLPVRKEPEIFVAK
ncbi:MAG: 4Fe-4S binding protein [Eubacterium sp.]